MKQLKLSYPSNIKINRMIAIWSALIFVLVVLFFVTFWVWYKVAFPKEKISLSCERLVPGLTLSARYPSNLAPGDRGEIWVTITNISDSPLLINDNLVVYFFDPTTMMLDPETSNLISLKGMKPGEIRTKVVRFYVNERMHNLIKPLKVMWVSFKLSKSPEFCNKKRNIGINIVPMYMLQTTAIPFVAKFGLGAVFVSVMGLFWESFIKRNVIPS